jgi:hypothetical protein
MSPRPLKLTPEYVAVVRGVHELHRLSIAGNDDSPEADAIRDATDQPWNALPEVERNRVRYLSEDLYSLVEQPPVAQSMNAEAREKLSEAFEARHRGEWDKALDLVRQWRACIDPALVSYLRGSIWLEAGDPATASLFFEHAATLQPDNVKYQEMFLYTLTIADPDAARKRVEAILRNNEAFLPATIA